MLETIQQSVKHHDQYQIEIKLDYELHAGAKNTLPNRYLFLCAAKSWVSWRKRIPGRPFTRTYKATFA